MNKMIIDKIVDKADELRLKACMSYSKSGTDVVPYKEQIVTSGHLPGFYFIVTENYIFKGRGLQDSEYQVYSFDGEGNFIRREDVERLGKEFFATMKTVKNLCE
jgi:hypothetical protein